MSKKIILSVAGKDIEFQPTQQLYGEYIGAIARSEITSASHNFVMQSASSDDDKQILRDLDSENPAAMTQIASVLIAEYAPKVDVFVKK